MGWLVPSAWELLCLCHHRRALGQPQPPGLFILLCRMLCKALPPLVGTLGPRLAFAFQGEAIWRPSARDWWAEAAGETLAFPLLGFLWALLWSLPFRGVLWPLDLISGRSPAIRLGWFCLCSRDLQRGPAAQHVQSVTQLPCVSVGISGRVTCAHVWLCPCRVLLSPSLPLTLAPLCSLWLRKQSLWQVKEVPALPGGGPAGLHLIMAAPPRPSPLSLLL